MIFGALDTRLQHGLGRTLRSLDQGMRRVGSGLRVSRAADDAAGLAVAEGLDAVVRSKRVATRNIQDGLSALDVADAGLGTITERLHRLRELAVQGASETLSIGAREGLQLEAEGLVSDITKTALSTQWQGKPLLAEGVIDVGLLIDLSGSMGGELNRIKTEIASFKQIFRLAGMNVSMGLGVMGQDRQDGVTRLVDLGDAAFGRTLDDLATIGGTAMDPWSALLNSSGTQVEEGEDGNDAFGWHDIASSKVLIVLTDTGRETSYVSTTQAEVATKLAADDIEVHAITRPARMGSFSTITSGTGGATHDIGAPSGTGIASALASIASSLAVMPPEEPLSVQVSHGSDEAHRIDLATPANVTSLALGVEDVDLSTAEGAREAIDAVDAALDTVNAARSKVGASENRLWSALRSSETQTEALEAAESRIRDADLAHESARLAKDQLIAQAALAIAAQLRQAEQQAVRALLE